MYNFARAHFFSLHRYSVHEVDINEWKLNTNKAILFIKYLQCKIILSNIDNIILYIYCFTQRHSVKKLNTERRRNFKILT